MRVSLSSNIWRLGRVRDTQFGINVSDKKLPNATKYQMYRFTASTVSELLKENKHGSKKTPTSNPPPRLE